MKKGQLTFPFTIILTALFLFWYFKLGGESIIGQLPFEYTEQLIIFIIVIASLMVLYKIGAFFVRSIMLKMGGKEGEIGMIQGVYKFIIITVGILTLLSSWFSLGSLGAIFAAFGGMFLGWSLQAPISGLAAWFLVSVIRPFSVGDRVQLPSYSLVGDIVHITPLYTILNQVGGSVGSEEPANRTVLIPNAMLFSALVINYTPKDQSELIELSKKRKVTEGSPESAYMLDEFVLRLSFDSDWDEAEKILLNAAREVTADVIEKTGQDPYIRSDMSDWYGVYMRLRFMTIATDRPKIIHEISKKVFKSIQASKKVDLAIPYIYSFRKGFQWAPPYSLNKVNTMRMETLNDSTLICARCGAENSDDSVYCNKCGKKLSPPKAS
jgi:small-conductance mechanosensitive channel/ribosomal protein L40E